MTQKNNKQARQNEWKSVFSGNVLMMGLVSFFTDFSSEMIYPLIPVFLTGIVPTAAAAVYLGLMEGLSESTANILKIFSGKISDSIKKRKAPTAIGYGISTIARPCMALATIGPMVVLFRFFDRIGKGIRTSPRDALISESVNENFRGTAFSFHRVLDHAGAISGAMAAILSLYIFGNSHILTDNSAAATAKEMLALRWLFAVALIPGLAAMAIIIFKVKEIPPAQHKAGNDKTPAAAKSRQLPKKFYLFLGIITLFALGNSSDLFLVLYGKTKFEFGLLWVMVLWIALHISKIIFSLPGGMLSDKFGRRIMIVAGWAIYIVVYLGMAIVNKQSSFWILIFAYGAYYGLTEGAEKALVADYIGVRYRGKAYGLYHGFVGIAALPASVIFSVLWAKFSPAAAFLTGSVLAGAAMILLIILLSAKRRYSNLGQ